MNEYVLAFIGGSIIALSTSMMLYTLGRITGISGIISQSLSKSVIDNSWRLSFILGLIFGGIIFKQGLPSYFEYKLNSSYPIIILAGLLVGFGTVLGSGCTSGHGVCGIPRLSTRSITATLIFMLFGIITVTVMEAI